MKITLQAAGWAIIVSLLLASCAPGMGNASPNLLEAPRSANPAPPSMDGPPAARGSGLWIDASVPASLRKTAESWGLAPAANPAGSAVILDVTQPVPDDPGMALWVYALAAPFPTVVDGVSSYELRAAWQGIPTQAFAGRPLLMDESALQTFSALWGTPASGVVRTVHADELLDAAWSDLSSWAIVPFESLEPRWKILTLNGQSPVRKDFNPAAYPLLAGYRLWGDPLPSVGLPLTNRDPEKMTTIIMTGVTALVRATARTMEVKGITYPGRDIRDWMREADIAHISNEIPFYDKCTFPNPSQRALVFCSSPRYVELLKDIGTDVVELTGNHFGDYGEVAMLQTLQIYGENDLPYFGGGKDLGDARTPLKMVDHGNRIAFTGCNPVDVGNFEVATETHAGANPCDMEVQSQLVQHLKEEGYLVIATFQYYEYYSPEARPWQQADFRLMADSGAPIVSGSQAHFAQVMEFHRDSFIHYGLGNLFFDQMGDIPAIPGIRRIFLDRHVIYDNRYISTELLTGMMEDHARPRPMTPEERAAFLQEYFTHSGWLPGMPVPTPPPTVTLTPLGLLGGSFNGSMTSTP